MDGGAALIGTGPGPGDGMMKAALQVSRPCIQRSAFSIQHSRRRAFTLVEIMVVVAVIAILVGAIVPEFSGTFAGIQISAAAGRLGDMMAFCYSAAAAQQTDYRLNIEPETGHAWVTRDVELETGEHDYQVVATPGMQSYLLPETIGFETEDLDLYLNTGEEGMYYIQFRRDGTADFCLLRLVSLRTAPMEISLNGLTGRVTIREVPLEELEGERGGRQ